MLNVATTCERFPIHVVLAARFEDHCRTSGATAALISNTISPQSEWTYGQDFGRSCQSRLADKSETSCWRARLPTDKTRAGHSDDGVEHSRAPGLVYIVLRLRIVGVICWKRSPQYVGIVASQIGYGAMYSPSRNPAAA
jgi:hypothetical protein